MGTQVACRDGDTTSGRNAPQLRGSGRRERRCCHLLSCGSGQPALGLAGGAQPPAQSLGGFRGTSHQRGQERAEGGMRKVLHLKNERRHPLFHPHGVQLWGRQGWVSGVATPRQPPQPPPAMAGLSHPLPSPSRPPGPQAAHTVSIQVPTATTPPIQTCLDIAISLFANRDFILIIFCFFFPV